MRYERARNAALLLGAGLGGFLDGITLHQIAQWHQMLSATLPPETLDAMKRNMAADGWFHLATWLATLGGMFLLWSAVRGAGRLPSTRRPPPARAAPRARSSGARAALRLAFPPDRRRRVAGRGPCAA